LANIAALDAMDGEDRIRAVTQLDIDRQEYTLELARQQAIAIADGYYEFCGEEEARRESSRNGKSTKAGRYFASQMRQWRKVQQFYAEKYMVECNEEQQLTLKKYNTILQSVGYPLSSDLRYQVPIILNHGTIKSHPSGTRLPRSHILSKSDPNG
jgi:hypothetical protein